MEKCDCWHSEHYLGFDTTRQCTYDIIKHVCWGTKECDECSCDGDPAKCDLYLKNREKCTFDEDSMTATLPDASEIVLPNEDAEDLRKAVDRLRDLCKSGIQTALEYDKAITEIRDGKTVNTASMWLAAQTDGKTYRVTGPKQYADMRYNKGDGFYNRCRTAIQFENIETLMRCTWTLYETMTRAEAEKALGVEIVD